MKTLVFFAWMGICVTAGAQQINTDIFLLSFNTASGTFTATEPVNITARKGYDNQPSFSNNGQRIYYSANYTGTNDIYFYDIPSGKTFTITNTPATSEFSPMETPDGRSITAVYIEKDTVTQRVWKINLKTRKEKIFGANHDSIGYYWPLDYERGIEPGGLVAGPGFVRTAGSAEYDLAVYVLGKKEGTSTLRIIDPFRKARPEKILDDSIGRCIRQVAGKHTMTYIKQTPKGNVLKFYDLWKNKVVAEYFMGDTEDYCWSGTNLLYSRNNTIVCISFAKGFDQPQQTGSIDLGSKGFKNIKRISCAGQRLAFVADDL